MSRHIYTIIILLLIILVIFYIKSIDIYDTFEDFYSKTLQVQEDNIEDAPSVQHSEPGILRITKYDTKILDLLNTFSVENKELIMNKAYYMPFLEKQTAKQTFYIFIPSFGWHVKNKWFIHDVNNNKYFVPEGLIKINKDTLFEWLPFSGSQNIKYYILDSKTIKTYL